MASSTTSEKIGRSSALGWVRVLMTMVSPSFSRSLSMATDGSCHSKASRVSDVHDVTGTDAVRSPPLATTSRPLLVDLDRPAGERLAAREGDADVAPDGGARGGVRRRQPGRGLLAARLPGDVRVPEGVEEQAEQLGPVGRVARRPRGTSPRGPGSSSAVMPTLIPIPTTAAGPVGVSTRSTRIPATLRSSPSTVRRTSLGHFTDGVEPGRPQRRAHGVTRSAAAATARRRRAPSAGAAPRRSAPSAAASPTTRSRRPRPDGLVLGDHDQPLRATGLRPAR